MAAAIAVESNLRRVLEAGQFAVTAECGPPKGADRKVIEEKAKLLAGRVDAVNVTDCQTAVTRMSSLAAGVILAGLGLEPIFQLTCRDRNRIALQSDILGAYALGIRNILCLTGDHHSAGNHPQAKGVFDLDSIHLIETVRQMRDEGLFLSGDKLEGERPAMFIGAVENPFAPPYEFRPLRLKKKVEAGADFIQTQAVYDPERFAEFMDRVKDYNVPVLAGIIPLRSAGMARFMNKNVPGIRVPEGLIEEMDQAEDRVKKSIEIAARLIKEIRNLCQGVHIMAIGWEEIVPDILKAAGLR